MIYKYIDEIPEFLFWKHDIFTTRGERSTYFFARADKNDVIVTRFSKMAVLRFTFHEGLFFILRTSNLIHPKVLRKILFRDIFLCQN